MRISAARSPRAVATSGRKLRSVAGIGAARIGEAGSREWGGFLGNEEVGDVEQVRGDRLEHRSRRRKAACRSDGRDTTRSTPRERFTAHSRRTRVFEDGSSAEFGGFKLERLALKAKSSFLLC